MKVELLDNETLQELVELRESRDRLLEHIRCSRRDLERLENSIKFIYENGEIEQSVSYDDIPF
jgi:hypothetical protein